MARSSSSTRQSRLPLLTVSAVLLIVSLLPTRMIALAGWVGNVLDVLLAPVQSPAAAAIRWVRGPARAGADVEPLVRELRLQIEALQTQRFQDWREIERLRREIGVLQRGALLSPVQPISQMVADVIGPGSDASTTLLKVKAGTLNNVPLEAVAVHEGVHLVGRVVDVEPRLTRVLPLTDKAAGLVDGVIIPNDAGPGNAADSMGLALECPLTPTGDGRLSGPVEVRSARPDLPPPEITQGMIVRLRGEARAGAQGWPAPARMLVVGIVERVERGANLRPYVYVRPAFRLEDLSEVVLRWQGPPDAAGGGAP
jgi:cell shape-determining protein MreC